MLLDDRPNHLALPHYREAGRRSFVSSAWQFPSSLVGGFRALFLRAV